jgi:hypothetical protein
VFATTRAWEVEEDDVDVASDDHTTHKEGG